MIVHNSGRHAASFEHSSALLYKAVGSFMVARASWVHQCARINRCSEVLGRFSPRRGSRNTSVPSLEIASPYQEGNTKTE